jgi:hypothetical protein
MTTYKQSNFEQIAATIGMDVGQIANHKKLFESAALWFRLDGRRPTRIAPSELLRKLDRVAKNAGRLGAHSDRSCRGDGKAARCHAGGGEDRAARAD